MSHTLRIGALILAFIATPLTAAFANEAPTPEERAIIGDVLYYEGFNSWGDIEYDDGQWEIKNAVAQDGNTYDLKLDSAFAIVDADKNLLASLLN